MSPPPPIAISTPYTFGRSQQGSKIHQCIWMVKTRASERARESELASERASKVEWASERASKGEWASERASENLSFWFSIVVQFKKFERVLLHKIVIRCPHHLQLQSAPHIHLGGLSKRVRYTNVFEWWKWGRVSERVC